MLDIKWIRENPEALDSALKNRRWVPDKYFLSKFSDLFPKEAAKVDATPPGPGKARAAVETLVGIDKERRIHIDQAQAVKQRRNEISREIGKAKAEQNEVAAKQLMAEAAVLDRASTLPEKYQTALDQALEYLPNIPLPDVPVGEDEHANVEYRRWGNRPGLNDTKEHFVLGEALNGMDFQTATKLSGSRFVVLKKGIARLERALGQFMLDLHTEEHGYMEVQPPLLVRDAAMVGTGQLPKFRDEQFLSAHMEWREERLVEILGSLDEKLKERGGSAKALVLELVDQADTVEQFWLIPTAEVPLTNLVRESILSEDELPLRFTALTPCFRSEAGAAGKDTRGMLRQHQFDKVELVSITTPEKSAEEHERMLTCAEEVLKRLDLHYRVMTLCTGDMGFASQKTYDIEVWLPGQAKFREISSCSVCGDFQARRMQARYKPKEGKGNRFVHTLNGSGVAVGRALIAVMENYQNPDGSITVPDALRPYMRGVEKISA